MNTHDMASNESGSASTSVDLAATERLVNRLAAEDRASASASLDDRLFLRTRALLPRSAERPEPMALRMASARPQYRRTHTGLGLAAAATLALGGAVLAMLMAVSMRGGPALGQGNELALSDLNKQFESAMSATSESSPSEFAADLNLDEVEDQLAQLDLGSDDAFWSYGLDEGWDASVNEQEPM